VSSGLETHVYTGAKSLRFAGELPTDGQVRRETRTLLHEKFNLALMFDYDVGLVVFDLPLILDGKRLVSEFQQ
jgi:hypothetical protein